MQTIPSEVQEIYKQHHSNNSQPRYDELKTTFLAIIQQFSQIFFILDALDECTLDQRKDLCEFFLCIADVTSTGTTPAGTISTGTGQGIVKFFITSRKESDIERAFQQNLQKSIPAIEIEAAKVNRDIEVYVKAQLELRLKNRSLKLRNMELKNEILRVLTRAEGM